MSVLERPAVSVVIVTFNSEDEIGSCLDALGVALAGVHAEVIVLDNGSPDATAALVDQHPLPTRLLRPEINLGFGRGVNRAASTARGDSIVLLNPDTEVRPDCIAALLDCARRYPEAGLIGGRTIDPDGTPGMDSCWGQPTMRSALCFASGLSTAFPRSVFDPESLGRWPRDSPREVGVITGLLLHAPTVVWRQLGGFDERFFMYSEDVDLSLRAQRAGFRPRICPEAVLVHAGGRSSPDGGARTILQMKGRTTVMRIHWSAPRRSLGLLALLVGVALRAGVERLAAAMRGSAGRKWRTVWDGRREWLQGYAEVRR